MYWGPRLNWILLQSILVSNNLKIIRSESSKEILQYCVDRRWICLNLRDYLLSTRIKHIGSNSTLLNAMTKKWTKTFQASGHFITATFVWLRRKNGSTRIKLRFISFLTSEILFYNNKIWRQDGFPMDRRFSDMVRLYSKLTLTEDGKVDPKANKGIVTHGITRTRYSLRDSFHFTVLHKHVHTFTQGIWLLIVLFKKIFRQHFCVWVTQIISS